jgi:hypothetical protein
MSLVEASLRFPTVVFSIGLGIAILYWVFVLLGALDIDLFGGDAHLDVAGAGKGVGDALTGAKGAAEGLKGIKPDADADAGGLWAGLGLAKVPITISLSVILLVCWVLSLLAMHHAPAVVGDAPWLGPVVLPVTLVVGLLVASVLVRPLGGVFELREGKSNRDYVGYTCTITTSRVDDGFGQATVEDGGTVLVIPVRCDRPGALARSDRALIIEFDAERHVFLVEPAADVLPAARKDEAVEPV